MTKKQPKKLMNFSKTQKFLYFQLGFSIFSSENFQDFFEKFSKSQIQRPKNFENFKKLTKNRQKIVDFRKNFKNPKIITSNKRSKIFGLFKKSEKWKFSVKPVFVLKIVKNTEKYRKFHKNSQFFKNYYVNLRRTKISEKYQKITQFFSKN